MAIFRVLSQAERHLLSSGGETLSLVIFFKNTPSRLGRSA